MGSLRQEIGGDPGFDDTDVLEPLLPASSAGNAMPPIPKFTWALAQKDGGRLPQTIAHRGYKAKFPENTMASFKGAVDVGAHALETDIHLSSDGIVVLSHDPTLERCFGMPDKIIDCDWEHLSTIRTLKEPHEPMPKLQDVLEYLAKPGLEHIWLLLDIKLDNNAEDVMRLIAETIQKVAPSESRPWKDRVVLGCWAAKYIPLCSEHLAGFPITHIGFSTSYARRFLRVPNVSFNMLQGALMGPIGALFIRKVKRQNRPIFAWTVNEENRMRWCIKNGLDGIITDDPKKSLEVCENWDERDSKLSFSMHDYYMNLRVQFLILVFMFYFRWKFGMLGDEKFLKKVAEGGPRK